MISLRSVSKEYAPGTIAVNNLSLEVDDGELCVLVGPSGCGKTTTLKMINRLIEPTGGEVFVDGENVMTADPVQLRRRIGYVMQHGGLFPHQRVTENVAVVPKLLGWNKSAVARRVEELLDLVGLDPAQYGSRYPHELSGGERQRVGVARALGGDPPVLLMDEPFGAVDPITRKRLQEEFAELHQSLKKTVVLVTHDINEAVKLGTRIAVFRAGGVLEQHATPTELLGQPASAFVADFVGADRSLERLEVTDIASGDLRAFPTVEASATAATTRRVIADAGSSFAIVLDDRMAARSWASLADAIAQPDDAVVESFAHPIESRVDSTSSLRLALSALLESDAGFVVVEQDGQYVGALTPAGIHGAMRRAVGGTPVEEL